ncbi:MAG: RICIN domain-containing protein [Lacrimispora saccharolytica]
MAKAHASDLEDGTYTVSTVLKDGMVLDVADGSAKDGANARLWSSNGTKAQRWTVSHDSKGYVTLRNVNSGKALDVKDGKAANGSNVQQYAPNSYRSQKWVAVRSGSVYKLVSALSPSMARRSWMARPRTVRTCRSTPPTGTVPSSGRSKRSPSR